MNNNMDFDLAELKTICKKIRAPGIVEAVEALMSDPAAFDLPPTAWVMSALRNEITQREERALTRRLKEAKLKHKDASPANIDYSPVRGLKKSAISNMMSGDWVRNHLNCVISGKSGVGKTYLACALGSSCCRVGLKVKFLRMPLLMDEFKAVAALTTGVNKIVRQYDKYDLLILDDWGYGKLDASSRKGLMELFEARELSKSVLITSILPIKEWAGYIDDPTFSDAIMDRFLGRVIRIEMLGPSIRTGVN